MPGQWFLGPGYGPKCWNGPNLGPGEGCLPLSSLLGSGVEGGVENGVEIGSKIGSERGLVIMTLITLMTLTKGGVANPIMLKVLRAPTGALLTAVSNYPM